MQKLLVLFRWKQMNSEQRTMKDSFCLLPCCLFFRT